MADGLDTYYIYNFLKNILIAPDVEGVKRVRWVRFISGRDGYELKKVDTRNQQNFMISKGGIVLISGGLTSLYTSYYRKAKTKKYINLKWYGREICSINHNPDIQLW